MSSVLAEFETRVAALDHDAGQPDPDLPRSQQVTERSLAMSRAWLAGRAAANWVQFRCCCRNRVQFRCCCRNRVHFRC